MKIMILRVNYNSVQENHNIKIELQTVYRKIMILRVNYNSVLENHNIKSEL